MAYHQIAGNENLLNKLEKISSSGNVHHAYIFEGPSSADKKRIALSFAQGLLCEDAPGVGCGKCAVCRKIASGNHMDVIMVSATAAGSSSSSSVKDAEIEKLLERLRAKPYEAKRNIAVIEDADSLTRRAANRLLKTLEEPSVGTVIMLLSENITDLPITIRSRCVHMRVLSDDFRDKDFSELSKEMIESFMGREAYYKIKKKIESIGKERQQALLFLDSLEDEYRNRLLDVSTAGMKKEIVFNAIDEIEKTRNKIKRNVSVQYALKEMALVLGG